MTSYVRQGLDIYNGTKAPPYNVLSYTWGYYKDETEPPLLIRGIDWPVPGIQKGHFSVETFHRAILDATRGVKHHCEWLWVDIACIPQVHDKETKEAGTVRNQEIGRQVEIFYRAEEAFAWLCSLKKAKLLGERASLVTTMDILEHLNTVRLVFDDPHDSMEFLNNLENKVKSFETWTRVILEHPWLLSLWTLQEMVLRPDAMVLFDDGLLDIDKDYGTVEAVDDPACEIHGWTLTRMKSDAWTLRQIVTDPRRIVVLEKAENTALSTMRFPQYTGTISSIISRLQHLLYWQEEKGITALDVAFPNMVYSLAQHRRVTRPVDRIFGIMQTYGISCNPTTTSGDDTESQLRALEDDFGKRLVARAPVLSQLFIHALDYCRPRRSWLITQRCKANDHFWQAFSSHNSPRNHFTKFEIVERPLVDDDIALRFQGIAWHLDAFVGSSCPSSSEHPPEVRSQLFHPAEIGFPERYRGLMLDYHVSKAILGNVVDYFKDHESMSSAVQLLHVVYCGTTNSCVNFSKLQVALLGSGSTVPFIPVEDYVGLVVALVAQKDGTENPSSFEPMQWERIGLMRWTETYRNSTEDLMHLVLPPYHALDCVIV